MDMPLEIPFSLSLQQSFSEPAVRMILSCGLEVMNLRCIFHELFLNSHIYFFIALI